MSPRDVVAVFAMTTLPSAPKIVLVCMVVCLFGLEEFLTFKVPWFKNIVSQGKKLAHKSDITWTV